MTPEERVLARLIEILEGLSIPYMLTGSVASSYHGRPRSTHDADVVIDPSEDALAGLVAAVERAGFYVSADGAREALARRRQFNVIDTEEACKVDLIIRKERPFSIEEFARRRRVDLAFRAQVALVTAEDSIVSKLEWASRSEDPSRQLADIAGILEVQTSLDHAYIERWATELGLTALWARARRAQGG